MNYGGGATLASYGVTPPKISDDAGWVAAAEALAAATPPSHLEFLRNTSLYSTFGDYIFVHAGLRPEVALPDQKMNDLTSIRGPFLEAVEPAPGHVVVFGHTPFEAPLVQQRKIGVDTGACVTGMLTALAARTASVVSCRPAPRIASGICRLSARNRRSRRGGCRPRRMR